MDAAEQRAARRIERRVARFAGEQAMFEAGAGALLAVSGGPDSLALLHIVARTRASLGVAPIAAYIDHGIRARHEIESERAFVAEQAAALGVPFVSAVAEPPEPSRRRSPEERARVGRYAALARLAADVGADRVATGHTRTDQAETVLLRVLRGSGLRGLAAMAPRAAWPVPAVDAPELVRPLLELDRTETENYCASLGLAPRHDAENTNPRYRRNRVRAEILPALRAINPRVDAVLAALAEEARDWAALLDVDAGAGELAAEPPRLDVAAVAHLPRPARVAALRRFLQSTRRSSVGPARAHIEVLDHLLTAGGDRSVDLPDGFHVRRRAGELRIGRREERASPAAPIADRPMPVPGALSLPGWRLSARVVDGAPVSMADTGGWAVALDRDAVRGLTVGSRRPGDRIELRGMVGRKRLQDLFVDAKVPRDERAGWPVFRTERGIAWVPGFRPAAWATAEAGAAVELRAERLGAAVADWFVREQDVPEISS